MAKPNKVVAIHCNGNNTQAPCLNCKERKVGCHSTCEKYINYHNERVEWNKKRYEANKKKQEVLNAPHYKNNRWNGA